MSSALAIAGVTAVLRDLLNDGLINHQAVGSLGGSVKVSVGPPDRVVSEGGTGTEAPQLNLFLRQVTPNPGWRNEGLPSRDPSGRQRLSNPPLALDLHYLLSAYGAVDLHPEILLGVAMQRLHETPVLSRQAIRTALIPSPGIGGGLPAALRALANSGLENQIELIKITPEPLTTEELSNLWSATTSPMRPTAAYVASVVLIESDRPARSPLPVLARGEGDRGVEVAPGLIPPVPTLDSVVPPGHQPVARLGEIIELRGHHLDGTGRTVLLTNDRFDIEEPVPVLATGGASGFSSPYRSPGRRTFRPGSIAWGPGCSGRERRSRARPTGSP